MMYSDPVPQSSVYSVPDLACIIRQSINQAREPDFVEKWMSLGSYLLAKCANAGPEGRWPYFAPDHEAAEATINSNYRYVSLIRILLRGGGRGEGGAYAD